MESAAGPHSDDVNACFPWAALPRESIRFFGLQEDHPNPRRGGDPGDASAGAAERVGNSIPFLGLGLSLHAINPSICSMVSGMAIMVG